MSPVLEKKFQKKERLMTHSSDYKTLTENGTIFSNYDTAFDHQKMSY